MPAHRRYGAGKGAGLWRDSLLNERSAFNGRILIYYHQNPDFLFRNLDFLLKRADFVMKHADFVIKHADFVIKHADFVIKQRRAPRASSCYGSR